SPYTDDDDAYTTRATRARRAASSTWSVPVTLFALAPRGSFTDRGTDRIAAWWKTTRTPRVARSTTPRCRMSPRTTSSRRPNALAKGRLLRAPVEKLSSTRTRAPSARSRSTRWEPMKPAPPVTRNRSATRRLWHLTAVRLWPIMLQFFPGSASTTHAIRPAGGDHGP